jgi:hypothetical protein
VIEGLLGNVTSRGWSVRICIRFSKHERPGTCKISISLYSHHDLPTILFAVFGISCVTGLKHISPLQGLTAIGAMRPPQLACKPPKYLPICTSPPVYMSDTGRHRGFSIIAASDDHNIAANGEILDSSCIRYRESCVEAELFCVCRPTLLPRIRGFQRHCRSLQTCIVHHGHLPQQLLPIQEECSGPKK